MKIKKRFNKFKLQAEVLTIFFIDIVLILAMFHLSAIVRTDLLPLFYAGFPQELFSRSLIDIWWIFLVWIFFFYYEGIYTKRFSFWDEIGVLWKVSFFSTVGIFAIVSIGKLTDEISRTVIILMGLFSMPFLPLIRMGSKKILRRFGFFRRRVLILGAGETGRLIAGALRKEPNYGYNVIGFLDDDPEKIGETIEGVKVHRGVDKAFNYIKRCYISDLIIAMPGAGRERLQKLINSLQHKVDRILFVPDLFGMAILGTSLQHFFHEQAFALEIKNNLERPLNIFIKRCFDIAVSGLLIPLLSIPMAVLAILVRLDSKGPAIFSQDRVGRKGKNFRCYKFRTMHKDAEDRLQEFLANDEDARKDWEKFWKLKDDPRATKTGKFLRETSLDELPQLFNVLKGEMSLVGPRPYLPREEGLLGDFKETMQSVPPGITGLWQTRGRSKTTYLQRLALDLWYVRNWNLWLDIVILFKTIGVVLRREGAS